jgi:hypothetical protein
MLRRSLRSCLLVAALAVLAGLCAACSAATWPQTFSLYAGHDVKFTFDVNGPGQIVVDATWTGSQLYVGLADPSGKIVNTPTLQSSPVKLNYTATAADVQKGKQWTVGIVTPPAAAPSQKPVAQGQVSVKVPAAIATPIVQRPDVIPSAPDLIRPSAISSITPNTGTSNDTVTITGTSIPADKNQAVVWFTIASNQLVQGTILNATKTPNAVSYQVRVPGNDYLTKPFDGPVHVTIKGGPTTNELTFHFVPCPLPTITSHTPDAGGPNRRMTFTGTHFRMGDIVVFTAQGTTSEYYGVSVEVVNTTQLKVTIPSDYPTTTKTIYAAIHGKCGVSSWVYGPKYGFKMDPAVLNSGQK